MNPDDEVMEELEYAKRQRQSDGLILVTSLIDKVPNLGGQCTIDCNIRLLVWLTKIELVPVTLFYCILGCKMENIFIWCTVIL